MSKQDRQRVDEIGGLRQGGEAMADSGLLVCCECRVWDQLICKTVCGDERPGRRMGWFIEDGAQFLADAFGADLRKVPGLRPDGGGGGGFDGEIEACRETDGAEQAKMILGEPFFGIANGANEIVVDICLSADQVDHLLFLYVEVHAIDGEISALRVFFEGPKRDGIGVSAVGI